MRIWFLASLLVGVLWAPLSAQVAYPPVNIDSMLQRLDDATSAASNAQTTANAAQTAAEQAQAAAVAAANSSVRTVNGISPTGAGNVALALPSAGTATPPCIADAGSAGTPGQVFAPWNHTHCSKARKGRVLVPAAGSLAVTYRDITGAAYPFTASPICAVVAETNPGDTNVVNAQIDGVPTTNGMTIRITRTAITAASLLGINILSVPAQIATYAHYVCLEP